MKKVASMVLLLVGLATWLLADNYLFIHKSTGVSSISVGSVDSITFSSDNNYLTVHKAGGTIVTDTVSKIDSLTFGDISSKVISIVYSGTSVSVTNPYQGHGIDIATSGADVIVRSSITDTEVTYLLSGTASEGSFKIYSNYKYGLTLGGVSITNSDGPAINIQSGKKCTLTLTAGTTNTLADGSSYTKSSEDQKGTLFSEGQIVFQGTGTLNVSGKYKHAIVSDDYISVTAGVVNVTAAASDGIHVGEYYKQSGGTVTLASTGDGIDSEGYIAISSGTLNVTSTSDDVKAIKSAGYITVSGGTIGVTVSGAQSKGFKAAGITTFAGGEITVNTSGAAGLAASGSGYEPSYCTALKADSTLNITGGTITLTASGAGGKGISGDKDINITGGTLTITNSGGGATYTNTSGTIDSYSGTGISGDGAMNIAGGNLTITASGTGAKGISSDSNIVFGTSISSPTVAITNTGTRFLLSGTANYVTAEYAEPKAIKSDGEVTINSGTFTLSVSNQGSELIDSDGALNVNGGNLTLTVGGNQSKGLKSTGTMTLAGGTIGITTTGGVVLENVTASTYDPSYCTAIKGDGVVTLGGSSVTITASGAGAKGISADGNLNITSGSVTITNSGSGTTYTNSSGVKDSYNATCLSSDANVTITNGSVTCSASGAGGKTLKADGDILIGDASNSPTISFTTTGSKFLVSSSGSGQNATTDYCHPKTIASDGSITIANGDIAISSTDDGIHSEVALTITGGKINIAKSVEGIESKTISMEGGYVSIVASDDGVNATAGTVSGGSESDDGSYFYMKGGVLIASATDGDAVDSNGKLLMTGGTLVTFGPSNSTNEDIDVNGSITINGGLFFGACYNSNMFETIASSAQYGVNLKSSSAVATAGSYFRIQNSAGVDLGTFITPRTAYYFHFSSPSLAKSTTYYVYTGGTYTGGTTYGSASAGGYSTGGTYSGGTQKKTFTTGTSYITTTSNW